MRGVDQEQMRWEFDRQAENLISRGYHKIAGMGQKRFKEDLTTLRELVGQLAPADFNAVRGCLPFVIVVNGDWVEAEQAMSLVVREGKNGFTKMFPRKPGDFRPIEGLDVPNGMAYLLIDVERGGRYNDKTPRDALLSIRRRTRSPLTIDEGIAIVTHYPEFLAKNNCYSMLASRCKGDLRVPAIWITEEKRIRLGWCWEGNPHSWLGSASCAYRAGT